jgi:hypothetical protein
MWCNNAIICTVLWINWRYFSSKKDSVEIFNAYMQEVNLKFYNFPFILLTFLFWARCMHRKFQLQDLWSCALAWWCQKHHLTSHTHTSYFLNTSLHTTLYSHATPSCTKKDLRLLSFVPVYQNALYFPVHFSRWEIKNFYIVFPYSVKERVKQEYFSGCLKCIRCYCPNKLLCRSTTLLLHSSCPKPDQFGNRNMALLRTDIADCWLRYEYSIRLIYEVGTSSNASKCYAISAGL